MLSGIQFMYLAECTISTIFFSFYFWSALQVEVPQTKNVQQSYFSIYENLALYS